MTPSPARNAAKAVVEALSRAGFEACFAGGCVRDELLGLLPQDYDVATSARPDDVVALFDDTSTVGKEFAVVHVKLGDVVTEVATFRRDLGYSDGRHPDSVAFADAREDALRRDFTVNGMFLDPLADRVIDFVGGKDDLAARLIRAIGDPLARFTEDRLRLVRAPRFAARLDFAVEEATARAIRALAPRLADVSPERVTLELVKGLMHPSRARFVGLMDDLALLEVVLPEVAAMKGVRQSPVFHPEGDVFEHTLALLERLENPTWPLVLAALFHDAGKVVARRENPEGEFYRHEQHGALLVETVAARLKLSNADRDRAAWLVRKHMALLHVREMRLSTLRRLFAEEGYPELLALARADTLAAGADLSWYDECLSRYKELSRKELKPLRLVTGDDLIELGLRPGPIFAELLETVYEEQLAGVVTSKADALAFVKGRLLRKPPAKG
ncbi:MAG: CCA tRNA nucleotidyltransferase [Planctomycetota bacterium]